MAEESAEQRIQRYETVLDLQMKEIDRLRAEVARLTEGASAHATLVDIYRNRDLPESLRAKAAQAALNVETPRLEPQPAPLNLVAEVIEPLADVVARQRARMDRMQGRDIEVSDSGVVRVLPKPGSNGGNGNDNDH